MNMAGNPHIVKILIIQPLQRRLPPTVPVVTMATRITRIARL